MIICTGTMKALWKLLYYLNVCDFERLNQAFFPMHPEARMTKDNNAYLVSPTGFIIDLCQHIKK